MSMHRTPVAAIALVLVIGVGAAATAQPPAGRGGGRGAGRGQGPPPGGPAQPRDGRGGGQPLAAGTAAISGTIVVAGTGQPARRARVTLNANEGGGSRTAMTDEEGRYVFSGVGAGRYMLSASKTGHVGVIFGQTRPGRPGTPIQLTDGQQFAANLQLPRGSVITGTVVDEYGEPTPGTQVRVMRYVVQAGRRTLQQAGNGATDDRGIYRVYGLQPGEYIVSAVPRNAGPGVEVGRLQAELAQVREQVAGALADAAAARELATRATMLQSPDAAAGRAEHRLLARVFSGHGQRRAGRHRHAQPGRGTHRRRLSAPACRDGTHRRHRGQLHRAGDRQRADHADRSLGANGRSGFDGGARRQRGSFSPRQRAARQLPPDRACRGGAERCAGRAGAARRTRHAAARPAVDGDSPLGQRRHTGRRDGT